MKKGTLFLIPSPLADASTDLFLNEDIRRAVQQCRHFFAEDIKTTRRYLRAVDSSFPIDECFFYNMHKRVTEEELRTSFYQIPDDSDIGVISEAGSPGIADPGSIVVQLAHQEARSVHPVTGPSSIFLALMASGMNGQQFYFHGYLPIDKHERRKKVKNLQNFVKQNASTQIFMETPYRNNKLAEDLIRVLDPDMGLCIACNLHAKNGFVRSKTVHEWKQELPDLHKKPVVFLINYY